ncbi:TetR family transcriptional regulator [Kitasatospora indigofera]|uniref:TetR family transcriptional regulator n=1 Tax=Kitasatospora indigofera TaxID=67307 RepID=A0A919L5B7_9ACTN|nr:TetR/AcrR family transcriptional regulator C-terminal domain-containing protein [Kitasatospora indigofera]GHH83231.1 TetR family transcriptional regulator [Kitasatospora indigofera]
MAQKLDRAQVVDTALRLLNETGLDGLTLRRIATELDVKAPALYWHFANKQALLDEMATEMLRRMGAGGGSVPDGWRTALTATCRTLRTSLLGYRDGAKVFSGTRLTDLGHSGGQNALLAAFTEEGFALPDAVQAFFTAYAYTIGFVIEEQAVAPLPGEGLAPEYDPEQRAGRIGADRPLAAAASAGLFTDYEQRFERGLAILLAGIEAVLLPAPPA